jgi:hypothetical protein
VHAAKGRAHTCGVGGAHRFGGAHGCREATHGMEEARINQQRAHTGGEGACTSGKCTHGWRGGCARGKPLPISGCDLVDGVHPSQSVTINILTYNLFYIRELRHKHNMQLIPNTENTYI